MSTERIPTPTTYGDLRDGETILDKSGREWRVIEPTRRDYNPLWVDFWLGTDDVRMHLVEKLTGEPVTALRFPTHAEKVAEAEAEFDAVRTGEPVELICEPLGMPVAEVVESLGGEVIAEESAAEHDARATATEDAPMPLPAFSEFTDLERRSHLFLLHGVYAADVKFREKLDELHAEAHGSERRAVPHTHTAGQPFPSGGGTGDE